MVPHSSSIPSRWKARVIESTNVTTWCRKRILVTNRRNNRNRQRNFKMRRFLLLTSIFAVQLLTLAAAPPAKIATPAPKIAVPVNKAKQLSLVRVNVTGQPYDYFKPWQKKAPFSKRGLGAVLTQGRVLVTADLV